MTLFLTDSLFAFDPLFDTRIDYEVGTEPFSVFSADFDGDGFNDLAVANSKSDNMSILLNNSDGTFRDAIDYETGAEPTSVYGSDIDSDGDCDLVVTNGVTFDVSVFRNDGSGRFQPAVSYSVGISPVSVYACDLDTDGDPDLAVANWDSNTLSVLSNSGDGSFQPAVNYATGYNPRSIFSTDLDADGDYDLLTANTGSNNISVLLNNGDGTFDDAMFISAGSAPYSIFAQDLDGDGESDIAVADLDMNNISVLINNGDATFEAPLNYSGGGTSIFICDLDNDGDNDLVTAGIDASVFKNNGDGTFLTATSYPAGNGPYSIFANDFDSDGDYDLAVTNIFAASVSVLKNVGDGTFPNTVRYSAGGSVVSVDFDGDNDNDLATTSQNSRLSILINNGDGSFQDGVSYGAPGGSLSVFAADVDGDHDYDVVASYGSGVSVLKNNGDGTFMEPVDYAAGSMAISVYGTDLDRDSDIDLAVANQSSNSVSVLENNGDGTFQDAINYPVTAWTNSVFAGDLNGDGFNDLAVTGTDMSILINNTSGSFLPAVNYVTSDQGDGYSITGCDLDADRDLDLIVTNYISEDLSVFLNSGAGTFQAAVNYRTGIRPSSVFAADLDGDSDNDLVTANDNSNSVSVLDNNGDGTFQSAVNYGTQPGPQSVFSSDLDGDGDRDLAVSGNGGVSILLNLNLIRSPWYGPVWSVSTTGSDLTGNGSPDFPFATIQHAIDVAGADDTVLVAPGSYAGIGNWHIAVPDKGLCVASEKGADSTILTIESYYEAFSFSIDVDTNTVIQGFTLMGDMVPLITTSASPKIIGCRFTNADRYGALFLSNSHSVIIGCTFDHNVIGCSACKKSAGDEMVASPRSPRGGALTCDSCDLTLISCTFTQNMGDLDYGWGAVGVYQSTVTIDSCLFAQNSAWSGSGGALALLESNVTIRNSSFDSQSADRGAGALLVENSTVSLDNCSFQNNTNLTSFYSQALGGAIMSLSSDLSLQACVFEGNTSWQDGGAIFADGSSLVFDHCVLTENSSGLVASPDVYFLTGNGGAIFASGTNITMSNSTVLGNSSMGESVPDFYSEGAAIYLNSNCTLTVVQSIISGNTGDEVIVSNDSITNVLNFNCTNIAENEFGDWLDGYAGQLGTNGNISLPPLFCDPDSGDYHLYDISPCAAANNSCGTLIGALDVTCVDTPPAVTSADTVGIRQDSLLVYHLTFTEPDGPDTVVTLAVAPSWLTLAADSVYGAPSFAHPDTSFSLVVSDGYKADTITVAVDVKHLYAQVAAVAIDGSTDLMHIVNAAPVFAWSYGEQYETKSQLQCEIAVGTDNDWTYAEMWNPAPFTTPDTSIIYNGSPLVDGATYYGRIRARNSYGWSSWLEFSFRMNSRPSAPQLLGADNEMLTSATPTLWLLNSTDAEGDPLTYDFGGFHDTDCASGGANIDLIGVAETPDSTGGQIADPLAENCYHWWHARAFDGYEYSDWAPYSHFFVNGLQEPPAATSCLGPIDDSLVYSLNPELFWNRAYDPDPFDTVRYRLTVSIDSNFQFVRTIDSLVDTSQVLAGDMFYGMHYWWKVRAFDRTGLYVISPTESFWTWLTGDVDHSHSVDIADLVFIVEFMFNGGPAPFTPLDSDVNGDCAIDVADLVYLVEYMFGSGPDPVVCIE